MFKAGQQTSLELVTGQNQVKIQSFQQLLSWDTLVEKKPTIIASFTCAIVLLLLYEHLHAAEISR